MSDTALQWGQRPDEIVELGDAGVALRSFGQGPDLLFIHGVPTHGYTWRHMVAGLQSQYRCHVVDLPGFGDSRWDRRTDFRFVAQARRLVDLVRQQGWQAVGLVAHDTGATIARQVALELGERAQSLTMINTEIPGHRPPWIQIYQALGVLPGAALAFNLLLRSKAWLRSSMALGGAFSDATLLEGEFHRAFIAPLIQDTRRIEGMIRYMRGIQWEVVDGMREGHARLQPPVLAIWGEDDPTFPVEEAAAMMPQIRQLHGFHRIANARLLPHEEQPERVLALLQAFLGECSASSGTAQPVLS